MHCHHHHHHHIMAWSDWRLALVFTLVVALFVGLSSTVGASDAATDPVTYQGDIDIINTIIRNNPTTWGSLRGWAVGNDPCSDGQNGLPISGLYCEVIGRYRRITSVQMRGYGLPFPKRILSGPIPPEIGQLAQLRSIDLANNNLTGPLPSLVSRSLYSIDMSMNNLTGTIPQSYLKQPNIQLLDLGRNQLTGSFPANMEGSPWRVSLYLNKLTGPLQVNFNTSKLARFGVHGNRLNGTLPSDFLADAPNLFELLLQTNNFSGLAPASIGRMRQLSTVDLSHNQFSGPVPNFRFKSLRYINLSGNMFNGSIPVSISNCESLIVLSLSCNQLSGLIPSFLGDLTSLQILRLEVNQLSGDLPEFLQAPPFIGGNGVSRQHLRLSSGAAQLNFNASCNEFYGMAPAWCGTQGLNTCTSCYDEQRVCLKDLFSKPLVPESPSASPSASPLPEEDSSAMRASSLTRTITTPILFLCNMMRRLYADVMSI
eukprot:TRINITY_DN8013_c1_g1_i2.p1 TRINITY_DN8013_c1_g1~~TRINITY_DN8013_c1_g1_i2.p1  ORF type:complete len:484 (-),score=30.18 TRINITY_DN8013_c1_g1_i2:188-1639(-)